MTTIIYTAAAAGGKTAYALRLARETAVSLQAEVRVCVPTALQARAWRQRLADAGGAVGIHVLNFDQLVAACLDAAGETYAELSDPVHFRLLRSVIARQPLAHYDPLKNKPGFVQVTMQVINELKAALIDPVHFAAAIADLGAEPRLQELAGIYEVYQQQLQANRWSDRVGRHWLALDALSDRAPAACRDWPLLIVDGFDDFTPVQLALWRVLADRVDRLVVTLPAAAEAAYPRYAQTRQQIEAALGVTAAPLPAPDGADIRSAALRHVTRHLFAVTAVAPIPADGTIAMREAPDRAAEVRTALRWLKQQIVNHHIPVGDAALLARDINPYRGFIRQVAAEFGLPVRLEDGEPLAHSPVIAALMGVLRLHLPTVQSPGGDLARRAVVAAWRSPYFDWGSDAAAPSAAAAELLDTFARQQQVIRGMAQWQAAFAAGRQAAAAAAAVADETAVPDPLNGAVVARLQAQFQHFLAMTRPPDTAVSLREFVQWLETLIGPDDLAATSPRTGDGSLHIVTRARQNPATAAADVAALRTFKEILRGLVWAEEALGSDRSVSFPTFFAELHGAVTAARFTLPLPPQQPHIMAANVAQVRGLSFAAVAVLGLSEGEFPATISEDPFLRDVDRLALRERLAISFPLSTQSAEREFFYEAMGRARDKLLLTRPVLADNGADWVASPFWEAVGRLVDVPVTAVPHEAQLSLPETASWVEWWEAAAGAAENLPALPDASQWQRIEDAALVWRGRQQAETAVWDGDLSPLAAALSAQFGPDHVWSASRLETYQTCGFLFFVQHVLQLAPRPEPAEGLDSRQLGSIYHAIFEQVMAAGLPREATAEAVHARVTAVAAPILDEAPRREGFRETPWWSQTRQEMIANVTRSLVALAADGYEFLQAEVAFGIDTTPLEIPGEPWPLKVHGFIDRIDRAADGRIRIIDYKSGGKSAFTPAAFQQGKKLQLPLYALAAEARLQLGTVADGFYWHFQQAEPSTFRLGTVDGGVAQAVETAVAHARGAAAAIREGRFRPRPPDGGCPSYCPAAAFCWHYTPRNW